jgi:molybdenum cofactor cytidylyltransferase
LCRALNYRAQGSGYNIADAWILQGEKGTTELRTTICRMVAGIILAAGRSVRMGRSKALLMTPDGRTFVARLAETLCEGGVDAPVVVGRADDEPLRSEVDEIGCGVRFVVNADADEGGQLSSLLAGLREADRPGVRGLMVIPVDAPLVTADTVATLIAVFSSTGAPIVRARHQGWNGHPVIFSRALFDELRGADPEAGAKAVLRAHQGAIVNVDVNDEGVVGDVDTPEDYRKLFGGS